MKPEMYSPRLLDHFQNPRNIGELPPPATVVEVTNPICGDILRLSAQFADDRVKEARYQTRGCTASIACGSALTELLIGKSRAEIAHLQASDVEAAVDGLSPESKHAAVLCVDGARRLTNS